jgi:hypothetical protein
MSTHLDSPGARMAMIADGLRPAFTTLRRVAMLMLVASAPSMAYGESAGRELDGAPIDALKRAYLFCSRAAVEGRLDTGAIMQCSVVYEELKRRAFDGDFDKLIAWSKAQSPAREIEE